MPHKVGDIAKLVKREQQTIRDWTDRFQAHLSPGANPGTGKTRIYSDDDRAVMVAIRQGLDEGLSLDEIDISLASGGVEKVDAELFIQQQQLNSPETRAAMARFYETQLDTLRTDKAALQERVESLLQEIGELRGQVKTAGIDKVIELERKLAVTEYQLDQAIKPYLLMRLFQHYYWKGYFQFL